MDTYIELEGDTLIITVVEVMGIYSFEDEFKEEVEIFEFEAYDGDFPPRDWPDEEC